MAIRREEQQAQKEKLEGEDRYEMKVFFYLNLVFRYFFQ